MKPPLAIKAFIIVLIMGCSAVYSEEQDRSGDMGTEKEKIEIKELKGYFPKNTIKFDDNYNFKHLAVTSQEEFDQYFGVSKTMQNEIDKVNFNKNSVIAIMTKPSNISKEIKLIYYEFDSGNLFILYHIREGSANSYKSTALYLATIPKGVSTITFKSRYNIQIMKVE